ncbi:universal stress protein [Micromonospora endolithica]|uniref:Universal stress protein n=1 Tax=Micromonospora endolithica TaxID=230091 RepID=A0A3A9YR18_9ACTN|nr:universal stress protein [Micromonospora endolithica]RKN38395.1 universal stress protein [Micromonospora endolithica]TWJ23194.1 nucleotide-binding universal stress UspA family protein [Micromonospora endolithica]
MAAADDAAVLVGIGSERDLPVVRLAAQEAAGHERPLRLLHAFDWTAAFGGPSVAGSRTDAEGLISRAAAVANEVEPALPVSGEIVEGAPVVVLIRRSEAAFLVAVGDGGMANCATCVPADAPAVQLAARAGSPVLVVRRDPPPQGPVLVGVDGTDSSRQALGWAFDCARRRGARLLAVRVVEPGGPDGRHGPGAPGGADDPDLLEDIVAEYRTRFPSVSTECHTIQGAPGTVLVEQSASAQLVLIAARGDEPARGMLGAVSQTLLYHAPSPVVVVRGTARSVRDQRP